MCSLGSFNLETEFEESLVLVVVSACRRVGTRGAVGLRSRATGVAWPEPVPPAHGVIGLLSRPRAAALFHKLFARSLDVQRRTRRSASLPRRPADDDDDAKFRSLGFNEMHRLNRAQNLLDSSCF